MATMPSANWTSIIPAGPRLRPSCSTCCAATSTALAGADPQEFQQRLAKQRRGLARDFRRQLRNPLQREVFDFLFRKAQGGIALRENVRNEIVRLLAAVRRVLLELGDRLARRGVLLERDDIFFVELSELRAARGR